METLGWPTKSVPGNWFFQIRLFAIVGSFGVLTECVGYVCWCLRVFTLTISTACMYEHMWAHVMEWQYCKGAVVVIERLSNSREVHMHYEPLATVKQWCNIVIEHVIDAVINNWLLLGLQFPCLISTIIIMCDEVS